MEFIRLIKAHHQERATFDEPYSASWSDQELLSHVLSINCLEWGLTEIPYLPNVNSLCCSNNPLKKPLPYMPKLELLACSNCGLEELNLPKSIRWLCCSKNRIKRLPLLPDLRQLFCSFNPIEELEEYPFLKELQCDNCNIFTIPRLMNLSYLYCENNPGLLYYELEKWQRIWKNGLQVKI